MPISHRSYDAAHVVPGASSGATAGKDILQPHRIALFATGATGSNFGNGSTGFFGWRVFANGATEQNWQIGSNYPTQNIAMIMQSTRSTALPAAVKQRIGLWYMETDIVLTVTTPNAGNDMAFFFAPHGAGFSAGTTFASFQGWGIMWHRSQGNNWRFVFGGNSAMWANVDTGISAVSGTPHKVRFEWGLLATGDLGSRLLIDDVEVATVAPSSLDAAEVAHLQVGSSALMQSRSIAGNTVDGRVGAYGGIRFGRLS